MEPSQAGLTQVQILLLGALIGAASSLAGSIVVEMYREWRSTRRNERLFKMLLQLGIPQIVEAVDRMVSDCEKVHRLLPEHLATI
jgi:hypothetical protein